MQWIAEECIITCTSAKTLSYVVHCSVVDTWSVANQTNKWLCIYILPCQVITCWCSDPGNASVGMSVSKTCSVYMYTDTSLYMSQGSGYSMLSYTKLVTQFVSTVYIPCCCIPLYMYMYKVDPVGQWFPISLKLMCVQLYLSISSRPSCLLICTLTCMLLSLGPAANWDDWNVSSILIGCAAGWTLTLRTTLASQ